jgi:O-antigen/teichoic acid export membrane protein
MPAQKGILVSTCLAIVATAYAVAFIAIVGAGLAGWTDGLQIAGLLLVAAAMEMIRPLCAGWLQSQFRFAPLAVSQWLDAGLRPIVAVAAYRMGVRSTELVVFSYALAGIISVGLIAIPLVFRIEWTRPPRDEVRRVGRYSLPLVVNGFFGWLGASGDRYLIAAALGSRAAGIYVAASAMGGRISLMLGNVCESYFRSRMYRAQAEEGRSEVLLEAKRWAQKLALAGGVLFVGLLLALPLLQRFLLSAEFRSGAPPVMAISFAAYWLVAFGFIPQRINYAFERTDRVAIVELLGMAIMVLAVYVLGKNFGLSGAAAGLAISGACRLGVATLFARATLRDAYG